MSGLDSARSTGVQRSYDLSVVEAIRHNRMRSNVRTQRLGCAALLVIGAVGLIFAVPEFYRNALHLVATPDGPWALALFALFIVYIVVVAILFGSTYLHGGRDPTRLELRDGGFAVIWANGDEKAWRWDALRHDVKISDLAQANVGVDAVIDLPWLEWGPLTREACAAIIESARSHGMKVHVRDLPGSAYMTPSKLILIGRGPVKERQSAQYGPTPR